VVPGLIAQSFRVKKIFPRMLAGLSAEICARSASDCRLDLHHGVAKEVFCALDRSKERNHEKIKPATTENVF
jgi:hypothetical protein